MDVPETAPDPIEPEDLAATLLERLAAASEHGARGLHVQLTVPPESAYEWEDADGIRYQVHLPTTLRTSFLRFPGEPHEDGGPAAVFGVVANGHVPPEETVRGMADQLYLACVRWGRVHHAPAHEPPLEALPPLPLRFDELVESAIFSNAG